MPANLTPEYQKAEEAYRRAKADEEKLTALEHMLSVIPKHKGTEKMQADLKRRIAALRRSEGRRRARRRAAGQLVDKQGAGQVVLLGAPNAGKSRLVAALTGARPAVAAYPFTTQRAQPGMMPFEDVQIQLVDLPPVTPDFMPSWVPDMVRRADLALLVADLSTDEVVDQVQAVLDRLAAVKIRLCRTPPAESDPARPATWRRALLAANKCDASGAADRLDVLRELLGGSWPLLPVSAEQGTGLDDLRRAVFDGLEVIRVYSKVPGKAPDLEEPFVLPRGATVLDLARTVHKDLAEHLVRARIWGPGRYDGQSVSREEPLADGEIVELRE